VARIFISYATEDRAIAEEVSGWLRSADHEPFLDHDPDEGISIGEDWKQRLYRELRQVDAVIGVVTKSFVSSEWCFAELGIADARGCRLIPLRVESGVEHPLMRGLQYVDYHPDRQQACSQVLQTLRLLDGRGAWREGDNPFPGLAPFTAELSEVFFGRASDVRKMTNQLRAMDSTGRAGGLLAVVGPSGCGKSSLFNAGISPLLDNDPAWLRVPILVPGTDPLPELARALAITAGRLELGWSASEVRRRLEVDTDGLRRVADDLLVTSPGLERRRLLVMIDQAEELFTRTSPAARERFVHLLNGAMSGAVHVVVAMRSEFLDDLRALPALVGRPIEVYVVAPLGQDMLHEVIERPARVARLRLDDGLAGELVADTASGEALPLLAFILRQLANGLAPGDTMSQSRYHDLGRVRGALIRHADAALAEAIRVSGLTEPEVLTGLTRLVTVDDTSRRARRRIRLPDPAEPLCSALQVFVDRRLLLSNTDENNQVWLTVAHEALLTSWRPLDTAIAEIIVALRTARTVEQAAAEWSTAGRPEHYLWDEKRLTATLVSLGIARNGSNYNHNYNCAASPIVALDNEARAFLHATARRVNTAKERERRRRRAIIAGLSALLVLVTTVSVFAVYQRNTAQTQRDTAILNQIILRADRLRSTDVSLAAQLDVAGYRMRPTQDDLYTALITTENAILSTSLAGHTSHVNSVVFSPDGRTLASASTDHTVRLWNVADPAHPTAVSQPLSGHTNDVNSVVFSPDGRTLASGGRDHTVRLWNVADLTHPTPLGQPLTGHTDFINSVVFSPDGRTLASASTDHTVRLWNVADLTHPTPLGQPLTGHTDFVYSVVFSPDGRTLASGGRDHTVRLWNVADPAHPIALGQPLTGHTNDVNSVVFSPDGHTLASASTDHTVRLWNVADLTHPTPLGQPLTGHTNDVYSVAFSPDGHTLASGGRDNTVRLWNVADPTHPIALGQPLTGHTDYVNSVVFSPDGHTLVSASSDNTMRLWNYPDRLLTSHTGFVTSVAFSPDRHTLASASTDHTVQLWNVTDPAHPSPLGQPLTGHTNDVYSVAFSPDGHTLASSSKDHTVRLWNVTDPAHPTPLGQPLTGHTDLVTSLAFSPDGHTLASGSGDKTVRLWNVTDPAHPTPLGQPLTGHTNYVTSLAFNPDGHTLASGSSDHTVRLWNVTDPAHPTPLGQPLTGHTDYVTSLAFNPDGHTLASGSNDHTVRLWNVTDPAHPTPLGQPLTGHTDTVYSVAFSPDGHTLASSSGDNTVRLWGTNVDQAIQRICTITTNALTPAKWKQFISLDLPYHPPCP
jgi:WD40 repeat protein/energy-coupling factor transporter ATP-binding protein EcfA2